jgi:subfamily B ATP-binding cassette protein MsbA
MNNVSLYKRMLSYLLVYWPWIILSVVLSFSVVIFDALSLWFGASLIQTLFQPVKETLTRPELSIDNINALLKYYTYLAIKRENPYDSLKIVCLFMAFTFLMKNAFTYCKSLVMAQLNLKVICDMRNQLYNHSLRLPVTFFDRTKSGNIISLIVNDIQSINASMTGTFDKLFTEPIRVIFFIVMLFVINMNLTLAVFIIFPIFGVLISTIGKSVRRRSKRVLEHMSGLLSILNETINCVRAVKMFNMNDQEYRRFKTENKKFVHHSYKSSSIGALSSPITEVLGVIVVIILLWYGGQQVLMAKGFGAEDFIRFLIFLFSTFAPLKAISGIYNTLQQGFAAAERVFEVLDSKEEALSTLKEENVPSFNSAITISNVNFSYPGCNEQVLHDISFTIKKGSTVALVGSSGAGKSTILDLLPRFYDISSGTIAIDNHNIKDIDLVGLRHLFGIVSQETVLFNDTVFNNIAYGAQKTATKEEVKSAAEAANAWEFIERMPQGLDTIIGERGVMLSGGQRQRLSIARALFRNPPILILDEATSALDTESERLVQNAINNLIENRTALVVAHRLSTIRHADIIVVLENGRIVEIGPHEELLLLGKRYKYFYDIQFASAG